MQAQTTIEPMEGGKAAIVVTELPYQVNKQTLQEKIAQLARERKVDGIAGHLRLLRPPRHPRPDRAAAATRIRARSSTTCSSTPTCARRSA